MFKVSIVGEPETWNLEPETSFKFQCLRFQVLPTNLKPETFVKVQVADEPET